MNVQDGRMQTGSYLSLLTCLRSHDGKGSATTRAELMSMRSRAQCAPIRIVFKYCSETFYFPSLFLVELSEKRLANSPDKVSWEFVI